MIFEQTTCYKREMADGTQNFVNDARSMGVMPSYTQLKLTGLEELETGDIWLDFEHNNGHFALALVPGCFKALQCDIRAQIQNGKLSLPRIMNVSSYELPTGSDDPIIVTVITEMTQAVYPATSIPMEANVDEYLKNADPRYQSW